MKYCKINNCLCNATNCLEKIYMQGITGNVRQPAPFPKCFIDFLFLLSLWVHLYVFQMYMTIIRSIHIVHELDLKNIKTLTIDIRAYHSGFEIPVTVDRCHLKFRLFIELERFFKYINICWYISLFLYFISFFGVVYIL